MANYSFALPTFLMKIIQTAANRWRILKLKRNKFDFVIKRKWWKETCTHCYRDWFRLDRHRPRQTRDPSLVTV